MAITTSAAAITAVEPTSAAMATVTPTALDTTNGHKVANPNGGLHLRFTNSTGGAGNITIKAGKKFDGDKLAFADRVEAIAAGAVRVIKDLEPSLYNQPAGSSYGEGNLVFGSDVAGFVEVVK